jgi:hypothetical protein
MLTSCSNKYPAVRGADFDSDSIIILGDTGSVIMNGTTIASPFIAHLDSKGEFISAQPNIIKPYQMNSVVISGRSFYVSGTKYSSSPPPVCNGHGNCQSKDTCACCHGYYGDKCTNQHPFCFGKYYLDSNVCSGNGECIAVNKCCCESPNAGYDCHKSNLNAIIGKEQCIADWNTLHPDNSTSGH